MAKKALIIIIVLIVIGIAVYLMTRSNTSTTTQNTSTTIQNTSITTQNIKSPGSTGSTNSNSPTTQSVNSSSKSDPYKLCQSNEKPPCAPGTTLQVVKDSDPNSKLTSTCCIVNPARHSESTIQFVLKMGVEMAEMLAAQKGAMTIAKMVEKKAIMAAPKLEANFIKKLLQQTYSKLSSVAYKGGATILERSGIKFVAEKIGTKVAELIGKKLIVGIGEKIVARLGVMAAVGAIPIAGQILDAVMMVGMILDMGSMPTDTTSLAELINLRDSTNNNYFSKLRQAGVPVPSVSGPLDKLPPATQFRDPENTTAEELDEFNGQCAKLENLDDAELNTFPYHCLKALIKSEYIAHYIQIMIESVGDKISQLSESELHGVDDKTASTSFIGEITKTATDYLDTPEGEDYITERACTSLHGRYFSNGIPGKGQCSYATKAECDKSYDWGLISECTKYNDPDGHCPQEKLPNWNLISNYVEWQPNSMVNDYRNPANNYTCNQVSSNMRYNCDEKGLPYNQVTQLCTITPEYCSERAMSYKMTEFGPDCSINMAHNIMNMIFGTTLTTAFIKIVTDPIGTLKTLAHDITHPIETIGHIKDYITKIGSGIIKMGGMLEDLLKNSAIGFIARPILEVIDAVGGPILDEIGNLWNNVSGIGMDLLHGNWTGIANRIIDIGVTFGKNIIKLGENIANLAVKAWNFIKAPYR